VSTPTIRPCKVKYWSTDLATSVLRVYGYQAYCACGWQGDIRRTHVDAVHDRFDHSCQPGKGKGS